MLALTLALAALPPLPAFPSELRPRDLSTAPANAAIFALGDPAPPATQVGFAATVDGAAVTLEPTSVGCCVVTARFPAQLTEGSSVSVDVTAAGQDKTATFTVGPADSTAPTFLEDPAVVSSGPLGNDYQLVIGVKADDDTQIGMITATHNGDVVGATVDGFVLTATLPDFTGTRACVDVVVTDVANNATPAKQVCATVAPSGEGEGTPPPNGAECEAETDGDDVVIQHPSLAVLFGFLGLLGLRRFRR